MSKNKSSKNIITTLPNLLVAYARSRQRIPGGGGFLIRSNETN